MRYKRVVKSQSRTRKTKIPERSPRVNCVLPVEVDGADGRIKDLSATGAYLELDDSFELNTEIKFSLDMNTPGGVIKFDLTGEVVRVVKKDGVIGVGVKITNQIIR